MDFLSDLLGTQEEWNGLSVYPIKMKDYPLFLAARECISTAQQTWPVPWCTVKYLDGLIGMGLLPRLALLLKLALRLPEELTVYPRIKEDKIISLLVAQGERRAEITPKNFPSLRELIARQNGIELPDETDNAELVAAKRYLSQQGAIPLKADVESLIYSVAVTAKTDPEDILNWTVRRFQATERALDRSIGHLVTSLTLAAGGKFKGGNPFPSWKFDREETNSFETLDAFTKRVDGVIEARN